MIRCWNTIDALGLKYRMAAQDLIKGPAYVVYLI